MVGCVQQVSFWFSPAGGATIALGGVAIATLVSSFWTLKNRRWQLVDSRRDMALSKGEQVYSLIKKWRDLNNTWFSHCNLVMKDQIDYNEFLDLVIKTHQEADSQTDKIDFNISVHFPELKVDWDECVRLVWRASAIENEFKNDYKIGLHTGSQRLPALRDTVLLAHNQIELTLQHLAEAARAKL